MTDTNLNSGNTGSEHSADPRSLRPFKFVTVAVAVLLIVGIAYGIYRRSVESRILAAETEQDAAMPVHVLRPAGDGLVQELALPGNTQAFNDTAIYARTNGYLRRWYVDIGTRVKQGQLLAEIETPEVDRELEQARADLKTALANESIAQITATRWQNMLTKNAVSRQETDQAVSDLNVRRATVESMQANVHRLEQLQSFEKVYAPFSGVITARNTDIGALINAGSSAQPRELFHIAASDRLRIYVAVPEVNVTVIAPDTEVYLTLDEYPGQKIPGTIVRDSHAIDPNSRTLNVEIDVNNADGRLRPGSYVIAHFRSRSLTASAQTSLIIPSNALLFRSEGPSVGLVRNGKAVISPVVIGHDYGSSLEIVRGISPGDLVILHPSDSLATGTAVKVVSTEEGNAQ